MMIHAACFSSRFSRRQSPLGLGWALVLWGVAQILQPTLAHATTCSTTVEVAFSDLAGRPVDVAAASLSVAVPTASKEWQVVATSGELATPSSGIRLAVPGDVLARIEVFFAAGADPAGQPATFVRHFERLLACSEPLELKIVLDEKPGKGRQDLRPSVVADQPALPKRQAGQLLPGHGGPRDIGVRTSGGQTRYCTADEFEDGNTGAPWFLANLGDADQGAVAELGGRLRLTGDGTSLYHDDDHGAFYYQEMNGDFRAEVTLTAFPSNTGGGFRKAGMMVRSGLGTRDPRVMIQYVPDHPVYHRPALQFDYRGLDGVARELASTPLDLPLPLRVAVDRRGDLFTVYYSTNNGTTWLVPAGAAQGRVTLAMPSDVLVGMSSTSYHAKQTLTAEFDRFSLCEPDETPVPPPAPAQCAPNRELEILYLLDISGSMTFPYPGATSKIHAAREAMFALNDVLEAQLPTTRVGLIAFNGKSNNPVFNTTASARILSSFTTDYASVEAAAMAINVTKIDPASTTPFATALGKALTMLRAEHDPSRIPILINLTDTVPNIDLAGNGPLQYLLSELENISLYDGSGHFRPWGSVAWSGNYNGQLQTYDGEVLGNSMYQLEQLSQSIDDLIFYGVAIQGDGISVDVFREDLLAYGAYLTGGAVYRAEDAAGLAEALVEIVNVLDCGASLGDRLWLDRNGDGLQTNDEPGLPGITVTLRDGAGVPITTTVTDGAGNYGFADLVPGTYRVTVDPLAVAGLTPTYDLDGLATPHQATVAVVAYQDRTDVDFGYRPAGTIPGCRTEEFGGGLGFAWRQAAVGNDTLGSATTSGGQLLVSSNGTELYHGPDNGYFVYQQADGDFRVEVDIESFPVDAGGQYRKAGLMVRNDLSPTGARVMVQLAPHYPPSNLAALQFDVRANAGGPAVELGSTLQNVSLPIRVAVQRRGTLVEVFFSTNGGVSWSKPAGGLGGQLQMPGLGSSALVGVMAASYSAATPVQAAFDDFEICQPEVDPEDPPPPGGCDAELPLDATILLDMSGSMTWSWPGSSTKFAAAQAAALALTSAIEQLGNGSRVALVTFSGHWDAPYNLTSAVQVRSGLTSNYAVFSQVLGNLSMAGIPASNTTPLPIALATTRNLLVSQHQPGAYRPVIFEIGDFMPNVDLEGEGPHEYPLDELQAIPLRDGGGFLPPGVVAWSGTWHGTTSTYSGEPLANTMTQVGAAVQALPELRIFAAVTEGDGSGLGTASLPLAEYSAYRTNGLALPAASASELTTRVLELLDAALCQE